MGLIWALSPDKAHLGLPGPIWAHMGLAWGHILGLGGPGRPWEPLNRPIWGLFGAYFGPYSEPLLGGLLAGSYCIAYDMAIYGLRRGLKRGLK